MFIRTTNYTTTDLPQSLQQPQQKQHTNTTIMIMMIYSLLTNHHWIKNLLCEQNGTTKTVLQKDQE